MQSRRLTTFVKGSELNVNGKGEFTGYGTGGGVGPNAGFEYTTLVSPKLYVAEDECVIRDYKGKYWKVKRAHIQDEPVEAEAKPEPGKTNEEAVMESNDPPCSN